MKNEEDNSAGRADDPEFLLSQYLDGQLEPDEMERLEERMGRDVSLRAQMQRYARLDEMLAELREPAELDAVDFDSQRMEIMSALERKALLRVKPRFSAIRLTFAGVGALAAAALIAVGTWSLLRTPHQPTSPIVRVQLVQPDAPRGQVSVAVAAPQAEAVTEEQVAVECQEMSPKELVQLRLREAEDSQPNAVLMIGISPHPAEPPSYATADWLLE